MTQDRENESELAACVRQALNSYFERLDGEQPAAVYDMVLKTVERPMLQVVLQHAHGNQTHAAAMLGINRNTLRKKLVDHKLIS